MVVGSTKPVGTPPGTVLRAAFPDVLSKKVAGSVDRQCPLSGKQEGRCNCHDVVYKKKDPVGTTSESNETNHWRLLGTSSMSGRRLRILHLASQ